MSAVKFNRVGTETPKVESTATRPLATPAKGPVATGDHVVHGKLPEAPKVAGNLRVNRFGSVEQALGRDPVNAILARMDGMSDTDAAEFLGEIFAENIEGIA